LADHIAGAIDRRIKSTANLSQLAQIVVNLIFFETACLELTSLLVTLRASHRGGTVALESVQSFERTVELCHTRIVRNIALKLDACFDLAGYDWQARSPPPPATADADTDPSTYLTEMVDYLTTVVDSVLVQLPSTVRDGIYRGALEHISDTMLVRAVLVCCPRSSVTLQPQGFLVEPQPNKMNENGLAFFAIDVRFMARHAAELVGRMDDVFEELSQIVALLQSESVADFLDPDIRDLAYGRVQGKNLSAVLVKLITYANSVSPSLVDARRKRDMVRARCVRLGDP
jgi:hypothetical protein